MPCFTTTLFASGQAVAQRSRETGGSTVWVLPPPIANLALQKSTKVRVLTSNKLTALQNHLEFQGRLNYSPTSLRL